MSLQARIERSWQLCLFTPLLLLIACGRSELPEDLHPFVMPDEVPAPTDNPTTPEKVRLGKKLFFDPRLSGSGWISCATCHNPALGWGDGLAFGFGHGMTELPRHTPTIINSAFNHNQFWDGRADSLEVQAAGPITAAIEMNETLEGVVAKLAAIEGYRMLFAAAFPYEPQVSERNVLRAIASFERTIISRNAPFDRWLQGDKDAISESARRGFEIFRGEAKCVLCHQGFNFTDNGFHNIGVADGFDEEGQPFQNDLGRYEHVPIAVLRGAFKTPTLRHVAENPPYMHNGSYDTLEEVIEHYVRAGDVKENLSPTLSELELSEQDKRDLVEFLKSLTGELPEITLPLLPL